MANKESCPMKKTSIGGQALIEGVMMRGPQRTAMAVRHTSGEIRMEAWDNPVTKRPGFTKWPFIRGVFNYIDSMKYGYKCLMRSAEMSGLEEEIEAEEAKAKAEKAAKKAAAHSTEVPADVCAEAPTEAPEEASAVDSAAVSVADEAEPAAVAVETAPPKEEKKTGALMNAVMVVGMVLGVGLSLVLFMWLPIQLFNWLKAAVPSLDNPYIRAIFEGVLRIIIFLVYMILVSRMKDIRRTFQYHGAEHKTIFCYEKGLPLTVENVREQQRFHPRCGTSFLILMLLVGIIISIFIRVDHVLLRTVIKLLLLPLTVGVGYELIKLAGRKDNLFTRIISAPGMWMQRLTTIEPDDDMIECAIASLKEVIPEDPEADNW